VGLPNVRDLPFQTEYERKDKQEDSEFINFHLVTLAVIERTTPDNCRKRAAALAEGRRKEGRKEGAAAIVTTAAADADTTHLFITNCDDIKESSSGKS
jgi:hypothetical protein